MFNEKRRVEGDIMLRNSLMAGGNDGSTVSYMVWGSGPPAKSYRKSTRCELFDVDIPISFPSITLSKMSFSFAPSQLCPAFLHFLSHPTRNRRRLPSRSILCTTTSTLRTPYTVQSWILTGIDALRARMHAHLRHSS